MSMLQALPQTGGAEPLAGGFLAGALAESLLGLLNKADRDLEPTGFLEKAESARGAIRHAVSILRVALDRHVDPVVGDGNIGTLAAWQINRVTRYIDEHLSERIRVEDLSQVARRSTAHFCRAFKRTVGETPHNFVTRRRLARAQLLMLSGQDPLSEIALACGFSDQAHLCNRFRDATGKSPAAWRRERCEAQVPAALNALPVALNA